MIGSQTRAWILKSLSKRRYTISELSRLLKVSKPTVLYHLRVLERSGYVRKLKDGRKWKYYELTDLGKSLAKILSPIAVIVAIVAIITRVRKLERRPKLAAIERSLVPSVQKTPIPAPISTPPVISTSKPMGFSWFEVVGLILAVLAVILVLIYVYKKKNK